MEEVLQMIREGHYRDSMTQDDCLYALELLENMDQFLVREEDVPHYWNLTCYWMVHFDLPWSEDGYWLETRHGIVDFNKKVVTDWIMAVDDPFPPETSCTVLRSGRQLNTTASVPSHTQKRHRRRRPKPTRSKTEASKVRESSAKPKRRGT